MPTARRSSILDGRHSAASAWKTSPPRCIRRSASIGQKQSRTRHRDASTSMFSTRAADSISLSMRSSKTYSPPRRGGVAAPIRKYREATEVAQTGWSDRHSFDLAEPTTPALRATPPLRGGEYASTRIRHRNCAQQYLGGDCAACLLLARVWFIQDPVN